MTYDDYQKELRRIEGAARVAKSNAVKRYADAHNKLSVGDYVSDSSCRILIQRITYHVSIAGIPSCIYHGLKVKKDGTPYKRKTIESIYQCNLDR